MTTHIIINAFKYAQMHRNTYVGIILRANYAVRGHTVPLHLSHRTCPFKRCVDKWTACRTLETLTTWYQLNRASAWYSMMGYDPIVSNVWTTPRYQWIR